MTSHLDLDRLADLLAGQAPESDSRHLSACPGCSARLDELVSAEVEVAALLATLAPPPVPATLTARLQAAVVAQPRQVNPRGPAEPAPDSSDRPAGSSGRTVTPFPDADRRRSPLVLAAAAVVVVAAAAVATVALRSAAGPSTSTTSAASGTAAAPVVPTSSTGTDYAGGGLAAALPALLRAPARAASPAPGPLAGLHTAAQLRSCLSAVLPPGGAAQPLALDYAAYAGQPALVVVLPASTAGKVDVFVVGAGCRTGDDQTLFFTRLDRPSG